MTRQIAKAEYILIKSRNSARTKTASFAFFNSLLHQVQEIMKATQSKGKYGLFMVKVTRWKRCAARNIGPA